MGDLRAKKLRKNAINDAIQCLEMEIMNEELEKKRDESKRRLEALQRLQQAQNELRSKKLRKNAINDEIQCLELEIKNEELEQKRDGNKQRIEALQQAQNVLRSRFDNECTFSQEKKG